LKRIAVAAVLLVLLAVAWYGWRVSSVPWSEPERAVVRALWLESLPPHPFSPGCFGTGARTAR